LTLKKGRIRKMFLDREVFPQREKNERVCPGVIIYYP